MSDLVTTAERIARLQGHFFRHERFSPLEQRMTLLIEKRLADIRAGRVREAHGLLVSVSRFKECTRVAPNGALTLSEAADILRLDTKTIRNLMSDGFLTSAIVEGSSSQRWKVVNATAVSEFDKEYVSAKALAAELQRDTANMCIELYKQGVEPLAINGNNRTVFRRRDLY